MKSAHVTASQINKAGAIRRSHQSGGSTGLGFTKRPVIVTAMASRMTLAVRDLESGQYRQSKLQAIDAILPVANQSNAITIATQITIVSSACMGQNFAKGWL